MFAISSHEQEAALGTSISKVAKKLNLLLSLKLSTNFANWFSRVHTFASLMDYQHLFCGLSWVINTLKNLWILQLK